MAFETISTRATVVLVALMFSAIGCGGDECATAEAHLTECLAAAGAPSGAAAKTSTCEGEPACIAACINGVECSKLKDFYSTTPTDASKVLLDCYTECQSP